MVGVSVSSNFNKLDKVIQNMKKPDARPLMQKIGVIIQRSTIQNFEKETAPDGTPWKSLSFITKMLRRQGSKKYSKVPKILQDTGRLKNSLTTQAVQKINETSIEYGTNLNYAKTHQYGGKSTITVIRKKNQRITSGKNAGKYRKRYTGKGQSIATAYTKEITVPARPILGLKEADKERIKKETGVWLKGYFKNA